MRRFSRRQLVPHPSFTLAQVALARTVGWGVLGGVPQAGLVPIFGFGGLMMQINSCAADAPVVFRNGFLALPSSQLKDSFEPVTQP